MSKAFILSALVALTEARFGQEGLVQASVQALSSFGQPGQAGGLAGQTPGVLLAGANACAKLQLADQIVTALGNDPQVISAAILLVAAEKNFNPFAVSVPALCSDASLPATEALRGIAPLVDPAVTGSAVENQNSAKSVKAPFSAAGLSVAEVVIAQGFTNFTTQSADGKAGAANAGAANASAASVGDSAASSTNVAASSVTTTVVVQCGGAGASAADASSSAAATTATAAAAATQAAASVKGVQQSTVAGLDFGLCVPTVKFEAGLDGRKDTEFTFQAIDPLVNKGQEEALNPAIIFNRICDQLTNVCKANQAAKDACKAAQAALGGGTRDVTTADKWNTQLGFTGTDTNPDQAPKANLVGHT